MRTNHKNLLECDGETYYLPDYYTQDEANHFFDLLQKNVSWKQEPIKIFGKLIQQPRLTSWYGDDDCHYQYSGITMTPHKWSKELLVIKRKVEETCGHHFNSVLLNLYRNQQDSMGWHRDNEKELGPEPIIASISLGSPRNFQLKHMNKDVPKLSLDLQNGSLLIMKGKTQTYWKHMVPKRAASIGPRINLTFRKIYNSL